MNYLQILKSTNFTLPQGKSSEYSRGFLFAKDALYNYKELEDYKKSTQELILQIDQLFVLIKGVDPQDFSDGAADFLKQFIDALRKI